MVGSNTWQIVDKCAGDVSHGGDMQQVYDTSQAADACKVACSNLDTQPGEKTFLGLEAAGGGGGG